MKLYLWLLLTVCSGIALQAQKPLIVNMDAVNVSDSSLHIRLYANKAFVYGNERYILHIGAETFTAYRQWKEEGIGWIEFTANRNQLNVLSEQDPIWLSYGEVLKDIITDAQSIQELCIAYPSSCWYLGLYSRSLIHY